MWSHVNGKHVTLRGLPLENQGGSGNTEAPLPGLYQKSLQMCENTYTWVPPREIWIHEVWNPQVHILLPVLSSPVVFDEQTVEI